LSVAFVASCDFRSGIARENMEKYESTPTPQISPTPTPVPIDPVDIVKVDEFQEGDVLSVNVPDIKTIRNCTKFNRVTVNGDANIVTITGVCRQIMINGDRNEITLDAALEFVFNGSENKVKYSRYPNGKHPVVIENRTGNIIEKVSAGATSGQSGNK
jgi:hypothetical protein